MKAMASSTHARQALTPDALQMIDTIAREGSFAAAARELGKVPSALTYSVRQLEDALDVLLFDRSSRQAQLTDAGRELLHEGRRLLQELDAVANRVRRVASGWETELAICVEDILSIPTMFELVQGFCETRDPPAPGGSSSAARSAAAAAGDPRRPTGPPTRLRLRTEVLAGAWEALVSGQVDLAIGLGSDYPAPAGFELRPLGSVNFIYCVAPHHPLAAAAEPLTDDVLVHHRAVAVADTAQRFAPLTLNLLPGQDVLTVPSMRAKLEALLRGLGCGYLPEPLARPQVEAGRLVRKLTSRGDPAADLQYGWRAERGGVGIGRALAWWLAQLDSPATRRALLERHAGRLG
jgi:DNA-binding transcriptional LysR family regulator